MPDEICPECNELMARTDCAACGGDGVTLIVVDDLDDGRGCATCQGKGERLFCATCGTYHVIEEE